MGRTPISRELSLFIEAGDRRVFAGALEWPGWCRSAKGTKGALDGLVAYAPRYKAAIGAAGKGFAVVDDASQFHLAEVVPGNATTDFGAPNIELPSDRDPLEMDQLKRLSSLLAACWDAFDAAAKEAEGRSLKKGPRGGGREVEAMRAHIFEADRAYLAQLGVKYASKGGDHASHMAAMRTAFLEALAARATGELPDYGPRGGKRWTARYAIRRSAWHALDHAWEIEDRIQP